MWEAILLTSLLVATGAEKLELVDLSKIHKKLNHLYTPDFESMKVPHFVLFYTNVSSQYVIPSWYALIKRHKNNKAVVVGSVDCDAAPCASRDDVHGYPTIKYYEAGRFTKGTKYRGRKKIKAMDDFLLRGGLAVDPTTFVAAVELTAENFFKTVNSNGNFVMFYDRECPDCDNVAPIWDELANLYATTERLDIVKLDCSSFESACRDFGVYTYPTMIYIHDGQAEDVFTLNLTLENFEALVESKLAMFDFLPDDGIQVATSLNEDNFDSFVSKGFTFVRWFKPHGYAVFFLEEWEDLANQVNGNKNGMHIAEVDCRFNDDLCERYNVPYVPRLIMYKDGVELERYQGRFTEVTLDLLREFVEKFLHPPYTVVAQKEIPHPEQPPDVAVALEEYLPPDAASALEKYLPPDAASALEEYQPPDAASALEKYLPPDEASALEEYLPPDAASALEESCYDVERIE